jgi:hypothetical protein
VWVLSLFLDLLDSDLTFPNVSTARSLCRFWASLSLSALLRMKRFGPLGHYFVDQRH